MLGCAVGILAATTRILVDVLAADYGARVAKLVYRLVPNGAAQQRGPTSGSDMIRLTYNELRYILNGR